MSKLPFTTFLPSLMPPWHAIQFCRKGPSSLAFANVPSNKTQKAVMSLNMLDPYVIKRFKLPW